MFQTTGLGESRMTGTFRNSEAIQTWENEGGALVGNMSEEEFEAFERRYEREHREEFFVICQRQVSPDCKKKYTFYISKADYWDWTHGELVQYAFPYLTDGERELLISQTCDVCWDTLVPRPDDE
jgi:hypothetical protein